MGLTVADFTQTLLPVATGAAQLASSAGLQGGFSALLQAFIGSAMPGAAATGDTGTAPLDVPQPAADDAGDDGMAAALAAICAGLGLAGPAPDAAVVAAPDTGQAGVAAGVGLAPAEPQLTALADALTVSLPQLPALTATLLERPAPGRPTPAGVVESAPAQAPGAGQLAVDGPVAAADATVSTIPPPREFAVSPGLRDADPTASVEATDLPPGPRPAAVPHDGPATAPPADAESLFEQPPPGASPPAVTVQVTGVVRSVGDAQLEDSGETVTGGGPRSPERAASGTVEDGPQPVPEAVAVTNHQPAAETVEVGDVPARPIADLPEAVRQVGRIVVERVRDGGGTTRIHLDPPELGRVSIDVRSEGGRVHVSVVAERPEAAQLLRDHAADLAHIFQQHGLDLHVQVGGGGQERGQGDGTEQGQARRQRPDGPSFASILGRDEAAPLLALSRVRAAYNPDGSHVYRV